MSIFIITSGCYSDYSVHGYCTTEDAARKYCASANTGNKWEEYRYEEIDCFDDEAEAVEKIYYEEEFKFARHKYLNRWSIISRSDEKEVIKKATSCKFVKAKFASEIDYIEVVVTTEDGDKEKAEKIAYDTLYQWLAEQENLC